MRMAMVTVHTFQFFYDHPVVIICGTDLLEFGPQSYDQQTDSPVPCVFTIMDSASWLIIGMGYAVNENKRIFPFPLP